MAVAALLVFGAADANAQGRAAPDGAVHLTTLHVRADTSPSAPATLARPLASGDVRIWASASPVFTDALAADGSADGVAGDGAPGGLAKHGAAPTELALRAAYPNPAAARATVPYEVPAAGPVRVVAYDVLGREVAVLADGAHEPGRYTAVLDASALSAGVYVVRLTAGDAARTARLTVAR